MIQTNQATPYSITGKIVHCRLPVLFSIQLHEPAMKYVVLILFTAYTLVTSAETERISFYEQSLTIDGESYLIRLPRGYQLQLLSRSLSQPRMLTFLPNKDLLAGSRSGNIYRLSPPYTSASILLKLDDYPHSVAYYDNYLYIAQTHGLYKVRYTPGQASIKRSDIRLLAALPTGGHSSRTVKKGPDNRIYLSIGISGNCSDEYLHESYNFDARRGGIFLLDESRPTARLIPFASGLRNPVGFDWHPESKTMYASNNGPDHQGFHQPPEYFSEVTYGSFHGMPWYQFNGKHIRKDSCASSPPPLPASKVTLPVATFAARNAPMDVHFIDKNTMDKRFRHNAIIALRGSWGTISHGNFAQKKASRREPKLVMVHFSEKHKLIVSDLLSGFQLRNGDRWARPVGIASGPDGDLYFTSDSGISGLFRLHKLNR